MACACTYLFLGPRPGDVPVVQPHQQCGVGHGVANITPSDIGTVQKWEGLRTCLKHRCVR